MRRDNSEDAFRLIALGMRTQALCVISIQITHTTFSICMIWTSFIKYATPSQNLICAWKIPRVSTKSNMKRSERRGADGVYDHDNPKLCVCVRDLLKIAVWFVLAPSTIFHTLLPTWRWAARGKKIFPVFLLKLLSVCCLRKVTSCPPSERLGFCTGFCSVSPWFSHNPLDNPLVLLSTELLLQTLMQTIGKCA